MLSNSTFLKSTKTKDDRYNDYDSYRKEDNKKKSKDFDRKAKREQKRNWE